jgi:hypothetical protein
MGDLLSSVSGQFGKALILGSFFPSLLFVVLNTVVVAPFVPPAWSFFRPLETVDPQWRILVVALVSITLSVFLSALNTSIIRFFESYGWKDSVLGRWPSKTRQARYDRLFYAIDARWAGMRTLLRYINSANQTLKERSERFKSSEPILSQIKAQLEDNRSTYADIMGSWMQVGITRNFDYPEAKALLLPTRLGNIMRSFEEYPSRQYGMDAVALMPRLLGKIDAQYAAALDDAKTSFDLFINTSSLSALLALEVLVVGIIYPVSFVSPTFALLWLFFIAIFVSVAYWSYLLSIGRAKAWGNTVKAAFDLYRWDLLKQLGHKQQPVTKRTERELWETITRQVIYGDRPEGAEPDYDSVPRSTPYIHDSSGEILDSTLGISRGVRQPPQYGSVAITLCIRNSLDKAAEGLFVADSPPGGHEYLWGSARAGSRPVAVTGTGPYSFALPKIPAHGTVILDYNCTLLSQHS